MRYELLLGYSLDDGRLVVINSSNSGHAPGPEHSAKVLSGEFNVPQGAKFTHLVSRSGNNADLEERENISLQVVEIEWFRKAVDSIPAGHNAAVRFEGKGIELVRERLAQKENDVHFYLVANGS